MSTVGGSTEDHASQLKSFLFFDMLFSLLLYVQDSLLFLNKGDQPIFSRGAGIALFVRPKCDRISLSRKGAG